MVTVVDLLIDQIEFCDVLILNKCDMVEEQNLIELEQEEASQSAGWLELQNENHTPETEEYGISSFVYRRKLPFHPERLSEWFSE